MADRAAMLALPPVSPVTGWRVSTRLGRDHYVRLGSIDSYRLKDRDLGRVPAANNTDDWS